MRALAEIERIAKTQGHTALDLLERRVAHDHGWIRMWCRLCGREIKPGGRRHFRVIGRRMMCVGDFTFYEPK